MHKSIKREFEECLRGSENRELVEDFLITGLLSALKGHEFSLLEEMKAYSLDRACHEDPGDLFDYDAVQDYIKEVGAFEIHDADGFLRVLCESRAGKLFGLLRMDIVNLISISFLMALDKHFDDLVGEFPILEDEGFVELVCEKARFSELMFFSPETVWEMVNKAVEERGEELADEE